MKSTWYQVVIPTLTVVLVIVITESTDVPTQDARGNRAECSEGLFQCGQEISPHQSCISRAWVCDGEKDCPDGSDEEQDCPPLSCPPGKFQCNDQHLCIPKGWLCDGESDCMDGSDESSNEECPDVEFRCPPDQYLCDGTRICIRLDQLCDGIMDCPDHIDEGPMCRIGSCEGITCPGATCRGALLPLRVCDCGTGRYFQETTQACADMDECAYDGYCEQKCDNTDGSFICGCISGYTLYNSTMCTAVNEPTNKDTLLLYTSSHDVTISSLNSEEPIAYNIADVKTIDYSFSNQSFCYITSKSASVLTCYSISRPEEEPWSIPMEFSLASVQQMAYDWLSENWYFTDDKHERIFVCRLDGQACVTIVYIDLKPPHSIALDPMFNRMFFVALGETPRIEAASLTGTQRLTLVHTNQIVRPLGLTLDLANKHVYWSDAYLDRIERIKYDGSDRNLIVRRLWIEGISALVIHERYLYGASQRNNSIVRLHRLPSMTDNRLVLHKDVSSPTAVKIIHRQQQPLSAGFVNPCRAAQCNHVCVAQQINGVYVPKCLCRAGYELKDGRQCQQARGNRLLLYSNAKLGEVKGISLEQSLAATGVNDSVSETMRPVTGIERPVAIDLHLHTDYIYYSDALKRVISRRKINGSVTDEVISSGIRNCEGIAIDWVGQNIYWTDEELQTVSVARLDNTTIRRTLFDTDISHPRAIVLNPLKGLMFWTDWVQRPSHKPSKIERASMDGTGRETWVDVRIQWPNGLSMDYRSGHIYWCDAYTDRIESVSITNKENRAVIAHFDHGVQHPYGLVHYYNEEDRVIFFWTEFAAGQIMRYDNDNLRAVVVRRDSIPLFDLRLYDAMAKPPAVDNMCSRKNGNCSHLCLISSEGKSVCDCSWGWRLDSSTNNTCIDIRGNDSSSDIVGSLTCPSTHFLCQNGHCINYRWLCDGDNDCGDNSDEDVEGHCQNFTCPGIGMHTCGNNRCIYERWFCDGEDDCRNGEDEDPVRCNNQTCTANMTQCPSSLRCIPNSWICDHDNDCDDGFDELNCSYLQCRQDQFMCRDQRCISYSYVCDGDSDCRDNSDEETCNTSMCNMDVYFRCTTTQKCIDRRLVCNGLPDCGENDMSDEASCTATGAPFSCDDGMPFSSDEFACALNHMCIPRILVCDGDNDCGDGSDELNCTTGEVACASSEYQCPGEFRCLPKQWLCDGDTDCKEGSDEVNCSSATTVVCEHPDRLCRSDNTTCIKVSNLCDKRYDCPDGSDEGGICGFNQCDLSSCSHECHPTPDGFICLCPADQKLGPDGYRCLESDPCQTWGVCSQQCLAVGLGHQYRCACNDRYIIDKDGYSCKPDDDVKTYIIFSNRHEVRRLDLHSETYVSLVSGLRNTIALDFYYNHTNNGENSLIFWTDVVEDKIYKGTLVSNSVTNIDTVINRGLATAEGLAVDWITRHIYWVESNLDQIEVADFDGKQRMTLIAGAMESPRAIVVDPRLGLLFWTDWDPFYPRIERSSMSGDDRTVIVNVSAVHGAGWPNGIAVDYETSRLYWIDARSDSIHTSTYDGSDVRDVLHGHEFLSHPFAISIFGNFMYWSDWRTNSLVRANKWNGTNVQVMERTITQPFDLHIFHPKRQPTIANPCGVDNGGCDASAICLLTHGSSAPVLRPACKCPHMTILVGKTCQAAEKFLLFARKQEIRGVHLDRPYYSIIPAMTVPNVHSPVALDYISDVSSSRNIYWTDDSITVGQLGLHSANLGGTSFELLDSGVQNPYGLAIDWISQNLYVSSYNSRGASIAVSKLDGAYRSVLNISSDYLVRPNSLAVHPVKAVLFWTDEKLGKVFASYLDGENVTQIWPTNGAVSENETALSLSIDYQNDQLWWIASTRVSSRIMTCTIKSLFTCNPNNFSTDATFEKLTALVVDNSSVYFAQNGTQTTVEMISKNGRNRSVLRNNTSGVSAMKMYFANRLSSGSNTCSNSTRSTKVSCSQLCIPRPNSRVCLCTAGFTLDNRDQVTCRGVDSFLIYSNTTEILGIPLNLSDTTSQVLAPISRMDSAVAIDYNAASGHIYWVDNQLKSISGIKRDLTQREKLVDLGIIGVEGIAIDWVAGNVYWTDQSLDCIEVSRINGSHRYVIIHSNIDKPRSIVLDPKKGYMYWADWGVEPKIERARLDGSDRTVLLNASVKAPIGLALDHDTDTLYWCDQGLQKLDALNLTSLQSRTVVTNLTGCMGVAVLGDYVYWVDLFYQQGSIMRASKRNGSGQTALRSGLGRTVKDIKIFDSHLQQNAPNNPCGSNNGGCSELCLFNGTAPVCQCSHGRKVNDTHCIEYDRFLAFSKVTGIETIHMYESGADEIPNPNAPLPSIEDSSHMRNVIGLASDFKARRYFFSDIQRGDIQSVLFNGSNFTVIIENVGSAEGLAFDEFFQEIYWTSYTNSSINRISVNPQRSRRDPEKIVQLSAEDHPRAIVIDSCQSKMFWTNWNDHQASIMTSYLSGWEVKKIITQDIKTPNGLAIDHPAHKLYWSDARLDKIERCNFDGTDRKVVVQGYPQHVFGLAVYGDYLYWTDWLLRAVLRASKYTGSDITYLKRNVLRQPMGIISVAEDSNNCQKNPCGIDNGRCEHNCNVNSVGLVYCSCNTGFVMNADNRTCRPMNATCTQDLFACRSDGSCISIELTCNNVTDCTDGSDEASVYCRSRLCPAGYFHCNNGRCINATKKCDKRGNDDCGDGSDEKFCSCNPHTEFQCATGERTCILAQFRCDQDKDCLDASDEIGCTDMGCGYLTHSDLYHSQLLHCNKTTACILPTWICDGHDDCWDNSDEVNCSSISTPTCDSGWRPCDHGGCVVAGWWCDGDVDCLDQSDEANCTTRCSPGEHVCDENRCIPEIWRCDNHKDCYDGSDELNCNDTQKQCLVDQFHCNSSQQCIPTNWVCDGERDCPQGEDEHPTSGCSPVPCSGDEFQCSNYQCVRASFYCDGADDCGDASDEPDSCEYVACDNRTQFGCVHSHVCISIDKRCNGKLDCPDHSDEDNATCSAIKQPSCAPDEYRCNSGKCVDPVSLCRGAASCDNIQVDAQLRVMCGRNECLDKTAECSQMCEDRVIGYECRCKRGYQLSENKHTCEDVNECDKHVCSQYCWNTIGSFSCYCAANYTLMANKVTCKANSTVPPLLLVSNRYYLRNITVDGATVDLLASDLQNAVALDFDWAEQYIYWSDVMSSGSNISRMKIDSTTREVLHSATVRNPDGLAVDWLGRNLYWCDKMTDTIEVSRLDGRYRRVLVRTDLQEPRAIVVHPFRGLLFYTDWGDDAHIGRLGMDGSQRTQVITKDRLGWPNALTIDYITDEIIWADAKLDYIAIADLNGTKIRYILQGSHLPHVFAITTFEDFIYWTDWEYKSVERANKNTGSDRRNLTHTIHRPMAIQVFHPFRQLQLIKKSQVNPCANNGGCGNGTLCLIKPGGTDRLCACPEKHYQSNDKKTCVSNCSSSEFACSSTYKCIPFWWRCDGQDDCGDQSDEPASCRKYECRHPGLFQCHVTNATALDCISPLQICDGTAQCNDSSDEKDCQSYTCLDSQFKCRSVGTKNAFCIPSSMRCNGVQDCTDGSDEKNCPVTQCTRNQFECANKRCIPYVWRCDGDDDCGDKSDEPSNCTTAACPDNYLKCISTGRCVPTSWRCDGDRDCGDTDPSDEPDDCRNTTCEPTYFKCANSRCIPGRWRCDYDDDCRDGSDEINCTRRTCSESEFRCLIDGRCIAASAKCDGLQQCVDGSDEKLCNITTTCTSNEFRCVTSEHCIPSEWHCDRDVDCIDGSDEVDCDHFARKCSSHERSCANGVCIPKTWWCDGVDDCSDKSDEADGSCYEGQTCLPGYARCADNKCVMRDFLCDGVAQCRDKSDEMNCLSPTCKKSEWQCKDSKECIDRERLCDSVADCLDRSDEEAVCDTQDNCTTNAQCPKHLVCRHLSSLNMFTFMELLIRQLSRPKPAAVHSGRCRCPDGSRLDENGNCTARSVCSLFGHCSQRCNPLANKCFCDENYVTMQLNRSMCIAKGHSPYMVLLTETSLLTMSPGDQSSLQRRYPQDKSDRALDRNIKMTAIDYIVSGNTTKLFIVSQPDGAIYQVDLPVKLNYPSAGSSNKDKVRVRRDTPSGLRRANLQQLPQLTDIAIDWVSQRMYWTEGSPTNRIVMSYLNGTSMKTLINQNLHQPFAIAVDPESARMFWTTLGGLHARIESADLDGGNRKILAQSKVVWPIDITIDYAGRRLYWIDFKKRTIESAKLDGSDRRMIWAFAMNGSLVDIPYRLDVFEDRLYVLMNDHKRVFVMNKFRNVDQPGQLLLNETNQLPITHLLLVQQYRKKDLSVMNTCLRNPCNIVGALCINTPSGSKCVCADNTQLNGTQCVATSSPPDSCSGYCFNGGICNKTEVGLPKCSCVNGFYGNMCENHVCYGACVDGNTELCNSSDTATIRCICKAGFEGDRCDHSKCDNRCLNGGTCHLNEADNSIKCTCTDKYKGETCAEIKESACDGVTCHNGGKCVAESNQSLAYRCSCSEFYTGKHCETCISRCAGPLCYNHTCQMCASGTCSSHPDVYCVLARDLTTPTCRCPQGYTIWDNCSQSDRLCPNCVISCDSYCLNGGTCSRAPDTGRPVCSCNVPHYGTKCTEACSSCSVNGTNQCNRDNCWCRNGWFGDTCNLVSNDCRHSSSGTACERVPAVCNDQCLNGGTCLTCSIDGNGVKCINCSCASGFQGNLCDVPLLTKTTDGNNVAAVLISLFVIALIIFAVLVIVLVYRRQNGNQFKHKRMAPDTDGANVEISNPIYMKDYEDDDIADEFGLDTDKPMNFSNPLYDSLYSEPSGNDILPSDIATDAAECSQLLTKTKERKSRTKLGKNDHHSSSRRHYDGHGPGSST